MALATLLLPRSNRQLNWLNHHLEKIWPYVDEDLERNYELDDDEYELLQESNISISRSKLESKKFKRLRKARGNAEEEPFGLSDEEEFDGSG